jgi:hypothetical protein
MLGQGLSQYLYRVGQETLLLRWFPHPSTPRNTPEASSYPH